MCWPRHLESVSVSTFKASSACQNDALSVSCVPFYSGYHCPNGGTLSGSICTVNNLTTAPGICQSGYKMNNFQYIQD